MVADELDRGEEASACGNNTDEGEEKVGEVNGLCAQLQLMKMFVTLFPVIVCLEGVVCEALCDPQWHCGPISIFLGSE